MTRGRQLLVTTLLLSVVGAILVGPHLVARYTTWRRAQQHRAGVEILRGAIAAMDSLSFRAEARATNYVHGTVVEVVYVRRGPAYRLEYLRGGQSLGGIASDGRHVWRVRPDGQSGPGCERMAAWDETALATISARYWVLLTGRGRVAGRPAYRITILPRGAERPLRELWVDAERALVLRARQFDLSTGARVVETWFTHVEYDALPTVPAVGAGPPMPPAFSSLVTAERLARVAGFQPLAPTRLPGGFVLRGGLITDCPCGCEIRVVHLRYSDGVRGVSLFQRVDAPHQCVDEAVCCGHTPQGRVQTGGGMRFLTLRRGGLEVTLVSDLSEEKLRQIGSALQ